MVTPPAPQPPVTPPQVEPVAAAAGTYDIVAGDTLAKIAKKNGVTVKALEDANPGVDPKKLKIGKKLNIPAATAPTAGAGAAAPQAAAGSGDYTIKSGDTLARIAKKNGVSLKALRAANPKYATTDHIRVGDKLVIPARTEAAAPAATDNTAAAPVPVTPPVQPMSPPPAAPAPAPAPGH
jgi:LysM repeat protein